MEALRPKRHKVTVACHACRSRKIKCDGRQPVCEPCQKRPRSDTMCTWDTGSVRGAKSSADHIKRLEDRIKLLEERNRHDHLIQPDSNGSMDGAFGESMQQTSSRHRVTRSISPEPRMRYSTQSVPWVESSFVETLGADTNLQPTSSAAFIVPGIVPSLQDGRGSTDTLLLSDNYTIRDIVEDVNHGENLVGSSNARTFMQEVEKVAMQKLNRASQSITHDFGRRHGDPSLLVSGHELRQRDLDYILPPREQADTLITSFWSSVHVIYPLLDKARTEEDYNKIWDHGDSVSEKQSFLCLLNAIFALSSRLVRSATPNLEHSAATFCLRARGLLNIEKCSVRSVQSCLLLAQYFHSTHESHMCSMFVGLAIRAAQTLKLHLFETSEHVSEIRTREIFRRVWYGCIIMDREVSMLYGRPCMIDPKTTAAVPLPLFMDEHNLQSHTIRAQRSPDVDFYISSLGLYDILHDVLLNSCSDESQSRFKTTFKSNASIIELQEKLSRWENGIPDHLKVGVYRQANDTNAVLLRKAFVLHQRYTSPRPSIAAKTGSLKFHHFRVSEQRIFYSLWKLALSSNLLTMCNLAKLQALVRWNIYARGGTIPAVVAEVSEEAILDGFRKAVSVLHQYAVFNASIHRLTTILGISFKIIPQQYSQLQQTLHRDETNTELRIDDDANNMATFQYWCPVRPLRRSSSPLPDHEVHPASENNDPAFSQTRPNFDIVFDPDDFTWLMTVPFNRESDFASSMSTRVLLAHPGSSHPAIDYSPTQRTT
ncbi:hypothetical protein B7463_g1641, partial [Scytalidium lignicola]